MVMKGWYNHEKVRVNAIVGKRLAEQKSAAGKDFERHEAELTEREMTLTELVYIL